ncbi:hypothetical protein ERJ75_000570900 [Trypanosoma vivax]|nr:hypothetical protein ERJ75_000570900 [Trypanosoma vivax]
MPVPSLGNCSRNPLRRPRSPVFLSRSLARLSSQFTPVPYPPWLCIRPHVRATVVRASCSPSSTSLRNRLSSTFPHCTGLFPLRPTADSALHVARVTCVARFPSLLPLLARRRGIQRCKRLQPPVVLPRPACSASRMRLPLACFLLRSPRSAVLACCSTRTLPRIALTVCAGEASLLSAASPIARALLSRRARKMQEDGPVRVSTRRVDGNAAPSAQPGGGVRKKAAWLPMLAPGQSFPCLTTDPRSTVAVPCPMRLQRLCGS